MTQSFPKIFNSANHSLVEMDSWIKKQHPSLSPNLLGAANDLEAVRNWLAEFQHSPHTYRSYEKESLRFLYWVQVMLGLPLADLRKNHIHQYRAFLLNPQPVDLWCSPPSERKSSRKNNQWKPFSGPLGYRSVQTAMSILQSMFDYLMNAQYIPANPFALIKQKLTAAFDLEEQKIQLSERLLSIEDFDCLLQGLQYFSDNQLKSVFWVARSRFMLFFLAYMGLRVSEFCSAKWSDLVYQQQSWWLIVTGKGNKTARVPINSHCFKAIQQFRIELGLAPLYPHIALTSDPICMAFSAQGTLALDRPLSERSVHLICKEIAEKAVLKTEDPSQKDRLLRFSPHWLRHFSASMQSQADIPFEMIKAHHRHSKDETTRLYIHSDDRLRQQFADRFNLDDMLKNR